MLKKDFINLIQDMEDEVDIDETILANGFAKPIADVDGFNSLLSSNKDIQGIFDQKVKGAIDTFKSKGMQKLIDAEVVKRTGGKEETPEQIKIRELEERLNLSDREKNKVEMVSKFKDTLTEKKIPTNMMDFLLGADDDTTNANITLFEDSMKSYIESGIKAKLGDSSYVPPKNDSKNFGKPQWDDVVKGTVSYEQYKESTIKAD